jgi:hypothetical protein
VFTFYRLEKSFNYSIVFCRLTYELTRVENLIIVLLYTAVVIRWRCSLLLSGNVNDWIQRLLVWNSQIVTRLTKPFFVRFAQYIACIPRDFRHTKIQCSSSHSFYKLRKANSTRIRWTLLFKYQPHTKLGINIINAVKDVQLHNVRAYNDMYEHRYQLGANMATIHVHVTRCRRLFIQ